MMQKFKVAAVQVACKIGDVIRKPCESLHLA